MKPINLLPEQHRPRAATGSKSGSSYVVVGVLAVLLVGVVAYTVMANRITDRREQTAVAKRDIREAEAKLANLGAYGDFARIAAVRRISVMALAQLRFDWERFLRETAHVLPRSTWLTAVDASLKPENADATAPAAAGAGVKPAATLEGCARRQSDVATVMIRLHKLHRVEDVTLDESSKAEGAGAQPNAGTGGGCGRFFQFKVKTVFEAATPADAVPSGKPSGVPASLGGGS
jgi:Tfp pilus assembly protein PilN